MDVSAIILNQLTLFLLVLARITGTFVPAPFFGSRVIPPIARVGLAVTLSLVVLPLVGSPNGSPAPGSLLVFAWWIALELAIGLIAGFTASLFFSAIQMAGQLIDMQIGFGIVNVLDPQFGQQVPLIGNFKYLLAITIFLALQGHHMIISAIVASFHWIPIGSVIDVATLSEFMVDRVGALFIFGIRIALPTLAAILLTDIALGILARIMPQMNIFVVGISGKIIVGLLVLFVALPFFVAFLEVGFHEIYVDIYQFFFLALPRTFQP